MRKAKGLLLSFLSIVGLLLTALIPNSASAEELETYISQDFYIDENGEMKEIDNDINEYLPPLEELIPWDAYARGSIPHHTLDFPAVETVRPVDYLAMMFNVKDKAMTV